MRLLCLCHRSTGRNDRAGKVIAERNSFIPNMRCLAFLRIARNARLLPAFVVRASDLV